MKDKISRISRGMIDLETPAIRLLPESVNDCMPAGTRDSFVIEILSTNGYSVKGICFTEDPRVTSDMHSFMGRRVLLTIQLDASGMESGEKLEGRVRLLTNAGTYTVAYDVTCTGDPAANAGAGDPETGSGDPVSEEDPLRYGDGAGWSIAGAWDVDRDAGRADARDGGRDAAGEQEELLAARIPDDLPLFEGVVSAMIRAKEDSPLAFAFYSEAIRRGLSLTRLYESYIRAFPEDSDERMPREVLLYFSYDRAPEAEIREKLYRNVLMYVDRDSELYGIYEPRISQFAMNSALERRISENLRMIYDRMIYPGMIDRKAAQTLPDILKCCRLDVSDERAAYAAVQYPELGTRMIAPVKGNRAYVPVYFADARISLLDAGGTEILPGANAVTGAMDLAGAAGDTSEEAAGYTRTELFRRPDLLRRCFELAPDHRMLLLSAVREIAGRGIRGEEEKAICTKALSTLSLKHSFRIRLIRCLCRSEGSLQWIRSLSEEDHTPEISADLCRIVLKSGDCPEAWKILRESGCWMRDKKLAADVLDGLIRQRQIPAGEIAPDPFFTALCKYVFDEDPAAAPDAVVSELVRSYEGPAEEMYKLVSEAQARQIDIGDLPEKILTVLLFADGRDHIDETFLAYVEHGGYTDMMLRAYLIRRSADYFLEEREVIGGILFDALYSYMKAVDDPRSLPDIMGLALTSWYAERDVLSQEETELCQLLVDKFIDEGLIFRYTKKLRKKIRIPREICDRFYIEYHGDPHTAPKLLVQILPDEEEFHTEEMKRVYRSVYVMSTSLFMGDELHYLIYDVPSAQQPSEEGVIKVTKFHRLKDGRFESLNYMLKAIADKDLDLLSENMLKYIETNEVMKELFTIKGI